MTTGSAEGWPRWESERLRNDIALGLQIEPQDLGKWARWFSRRTARMVPGRATSAATRKAWNPWVNPITNFGTITGLGPAKILVQATFVRLRTTAFNASFGGEF